MKKNRTTRNAFITSVIALCLTVAMLIGTTFAWFTDSRMIGNNKIVSGLLHVDVQYAYPEEDAENVGALNYEDVESTTNLFQQKEGDRWEPGHTDLVYLKVSNPAQSVALKYNLSLDVNLDKASFKLASNGEFTTLDKYLVANVIIIDNKEVDVITDRDSCHLSEEEEATHKISELKDTAIIDDDGENVLKPGEEAYFALIVYMPEDYDPNIDWDWFTKENESKYPEIGIDVKLIATQAQHEEDAFGKDYDAGAEYPDGVASNPGGGTEPENGVTLDSFKEENTETNVTGFILGTKADYPEVAQKEGTPINGTDVTAYLVPTSEVMTLSDDGVPMTMYLLADGDSFPMDEQWLELLNDHADATTLNLKNVANFDVAKYSSFYDVATTVGLGGSTLANVESKTELQNIFKKFTKLDKLDLTDWEINEALTDLSNLFDGSSNIKAKTVDLSGTTFENMSLDSMFRENMNVTAVYFRNTTFNKVDTECMFMGGLSSSNNIETIDFSGATLTDISLLRMFYHCDKLVDLNLDVKSVTLEAKDGMNNKTSPLYQSFANAMSLTVIDLSKFDLTGLDAEFTFWNCKKLVRVFADPAKVTSSLTNTFSGVSTVKKGANESVTESSTLANAVTDSANMATIIKDDVQTYSNYTVNDLPTYLQQYAK